jgi:hypothetical protein
VKKTIASAQKLVEIEEMKEWIQTKSGDRRAAIAGVWIERLKTAPREFETWLQLLVNRISITQQRDQSLIELFQLESISIGKKLHRSTFRIVFPNFEVEHTPLSTLCHAIATWHTGDKAQALDLVRNLRRDPPPDLKLQCDFFYCSWLMALDDSRESLLEVSGILATTARDRLTAGMSPRRSSIGSQASELHLNPLLHGSMNSLGTLRIPGQTVNRLVSDVLRPEILRQFATANIALIEKSGAFDNIAALVNNAIRALGQALKIGEWFPDLVQMLKIFFEHGHFEAVFDESAPQISELPPKRLLQASPQLLVQLAHRAKNIKTLVSDILLGLLEKHFHTLIFSLLTLQRSGNKQRAKGATEIVAKFRDLNEKTHAVFAEVGLIRSAMSTAAVTWYERALQQLQDAVDHEERNSHAQMMLSLKRLVALTQHPQCALHSQFCKSYGTAIRKLDELIIKWDEDNDSALLRPIKAIVHDLNTRIDADVNRVSIIKLGAISEDLVEKRKFKLAVPGTYAPDRPVIKIAHFVAQFSVYLTKQSPKNVVMRGTDGVFYQYLLKGHEDLRLDERIMQFFRLINSYTKTQTSQQSHLIQTMAVIPLSPLRGLVQWVSSTDTLRAIIEQYRTLHGRAPLGEFPLLAECALPRYDALLPIHKQVVFEKVRKLLPDTDLANFFWLKAPSAEVWVNQISTFAISNGVSSIVGYLIGLGDRHPANLLIDRFTGKVIHIDFGDSFENVRIRENLPEVVPFRLTRMMVRAMGVAGVGGNFRSSFVSMSHLLRANKQVLLMLLAIFVQEPLVTPHTAYEMSGIQPSPSQDYSFKRSVSKAVLASGFDDGRLRHSEDSPPDDAVISNEEIRKRVRSKLEGTDFDPTVVLSVDEQADRLIEEAMDPYNLAAMYHGWLPFW